MATAFPDLPEIAKRSQDILIASRSFGREANRLFKDSKNIHKYMCEVIVHGEGEKVVAISQRVQHLANAAHKIGLDIKREIEHLKEIAKIYADKQIERSVKKKRKVQ